MIQDLEEYDFDSSDDDSGSGDDLESLQDLDDLKNMSLNKNDLDVAKLIDEIYSKLESWYDDEIIYILNHEIINIIKTYVSIDIDIIRKVVEEFCNTLDWDENDTLIIKDRDFNAIEKKIIKFDWTENLLE